MNTNKEVDLVGRIDITVEGDEVRVQFVSEGGDQLVHFPTQSLRQLQSGGVSLRLGPMKMTCKLSM